MQALVYQFDEFRIEPASLLLLRDGDGLRLERKPFELLVLLASSQGRLVTRAEIAEHLWGKDVFVDTEHGINTAIRKIRAVLRDDPEHPRFVQTVTGMGYRFLAPVETIAALGPQTSQPVPRLSQPAPPTAEIAAPVHDPAAAAPADGGKRRPVWLPWAALTFALCTLAGLALNRWLPRQAAGSDTAEPPIRSVAVLPLANYSGDPAQEYFADGMTDELITMLARNSTLRIPSRTSVMHYKATNRSLAEVASALGVDGIVEGSVSHSSNQLHMNLQLIRVDRDAHLWAESYDRPLTEVSALPEEAARAIAVRLHSASPARASVRYVTPEAHDAYLRGHYFWSAGRNAEAGRAYEQAVALQPDYALGWAGVSQYYGRAAINGSLPPEPALIRAQTAADRAVALDDTLPQSHSVLAAAIFFSKWDGERALREVERATELDPGFSEAYHLQALILSSMGRSGEAIAVQQKSTGADPVTHPGAMAEILFYAGRYDQALAEARVRLRDFPDAPDILYILMEVDHVKGLDAEAASMAARFYSDRRDSPSNQAVLAAYKAHGYRGIVQWRLAELEREAKHGYVSPVLLARGHAQLGDREQTLRLLEQALRGHDPILLFVKGDPAYNAFHADPRYRALIRQIGARWTGSEAELRN